MMLTREKHHLSLLGIDGGDPSSLDHTGTRQSNNLGLLATSTGNWEVSGSPVASRGDKRRVRGYTTIKGNPKGRRS